MPSNSTGPILPRDTRFLTGLTHRIKLIYRLLMDRRVNPLLKLLPLSSIIYFVFPDLLPGPIDDAVMIWLSTYLFVELCPPEVVEEHLREINRSFVGTYENAEPGRGEVIESEIIEAEFREDKTD